MTRSATALRDRVVRQLGYLIDITRVIDRNQEDGEFFRENGGTILYVFDTNVVQMFFDPARNPQFCETFHAEIWGDSYEQRSEINAQACLIAAEFLMSGALPGQGKAGHWYMSQAHITELDGQIAHLRGEFATADNEMRDNARYREDVIGQLDELNAALDFDSGTDRVYVKNLARGMGMGTSEIEALGAASEEEFQRRSVGVQSREICRLLAMDRVLEPRDQLKRFNGPEICGARRTLEHAIGYGPEHHGVVRKEAAEWYRIFAETLATRAQGSRSDQSIRADCKTLALLSWASRKLPANQRIVFVTGDKVLLDAYKYRYVSEYSSGPFLLRPINHFSPLFNPLSADSRLPEPDRLRAFARLQEALEVAMVALNLGLLSGQDPQHRLRARDHFALSADISLERTISHIEMLFPSYFASDRLAEQDRGLRELVAELRTLDLLMLEAYPHFVARRLEKQRDSFLKHNEDIGTTIDNEIGEGLSRARSAGFKLSLLLMPVAVARLLRALATRDETMPERAVVPTRLSFSADPNEYVDYRGEVRWLRELGTDALHDVLTRLTNRPPMVFALAVMLAFGLESWRDAARYADLAVSAADEERARTGTPAAEEDYHEFLWLSAVALRFRLAAWVPAPNSGFVDPWRHWPDFAVDSLGQCIDFHHRHEHLARELRAVSERASLNVSHAEWLVFGDEGLLKDREGLGELALEKLKDVIADLARCEALAVVAAERAEGEHRAGRPGSSLVLKAVVLQFRYNELAASLVGETIKIRWPHLFGQTEIALADLPVSEDVHWPAPPQIARAYLAASKGDLAELERVDSAEVTLTLDAIIIEGLKRVLREQNKADAAA